jgi:hypothetical protein
MNVDSTQALETKLESIIKSLFRDEIQDSGDLDIQADYETENALNEIVKKLGLSVYGMSITPSQFTITFEFDSDYYQSVTSSKYPRHLRIHLDNSGDYVVLMSENTTKEDWYCSITDPIFNTKLPEEEISHIVHEYDKVLTSKLLAL